MPQRSRTRTLLVIALIAALLVPLSATAASAEPPDAPDSLFPNGATYNAPPTLEWGGVAGSTRYLVQIADNLAFNPRVASITVTNGNTSYAPSQTFTTGEYFWRVQAYNGEWGNWSSIATFTVERAAPSPETPPNGTVIEYPVGSVGFSWSEVPGARSYQFEWDTDAGFANASRISSESNGAWLAGSVAFDQVNYWRARAYISGTTYTAWSEPQTFTLTWPDEHGKGRPVLTYPPAMNPPTQVSDVEMRWEPVLGAASYNIQVSASSDFNGTLIENRNVAGTRYSPGITYLNGTYWWRIQARTKGGNLGPWSDLGTFTRAWPATPNEGLPGVSNPPTLVTPTDGAVLPNAPLKLDWDPVDRAAHYELQLSSDPNFSSGSNITNSCTTAQTVATQNISDTSVGSNTSCSTFDNNTAGPLRANTDGVTYWRVRGIDNPRGVLGLWSEVRSFTYTAINAEPTDDPFEPVTQVSPSHCPPGASCGKFASTPEMTWTPVPMAAYYRVWVARDANFTSVVGRYRVAATANPSLQPRDEWPDNDAGQAYYWHVQICRANHLCTTAPESGSDVPSFAFQKSSTAVVQNGPGIHWDSVNPPNLDTIPIVTSMPRFTWTPYLATSGSNLDARTYRIQVSVNPQFSGSLLDTRDVDQTFYSAWDRTYPEGPIYWRVAAIDGSTNITTTSSIFAFRYISVPPTLVSPADGAQITSTPTLSWNAIPDAAEYRFELTFHPNGLGTAGSIVDNRNTLYNSTIPFDSLEPGWYSWRVRGTDNKGRERNWSDPRSFRITGYSPDLLSPNDGTTFETDEIRFAWELDGGNPYYYMWEIARDPAFSVGRTDVRTTITSWIPYTPLQAGTWYWRVHAHDTDGSRMGTSDVRTFNRKIADPTTKPTDLFVQNRPGGLTLTWKAPTNQGGINNQRITIQPGNMVFTVNKATTTFRIDSLMNGTEYAVEIIGRGAGGAGDSDPALATGTPNGCAGTPFRDVNASHTFCTEIRWMYAEGISTGSKVGADTSPTQYRTYDPTDPVTRQAMAAFLHRYDGPSTESPTPAFADVNSGNPFFNDIQWMSSSGMSTGTPNPPGKPLYKPGDAVSRQAIGAFLHRYEGDTDPTLTSQFFADVVEQHAFYRDIQWMAQTALSTGTANPPGRPLYKPVDPVSRMSMAAFLYRYNLSFG